jgi:integrase
MRKDEMLHLRWQDVDFLNDLIQLRQSKTASGIRSVNATRRPDTRPPR